MPRAIRWNGAPVGDPGEFFVAPQVAYLPQVPRLFGGTLREKVVLVAPSEPDAVDHALRQAAFEPDLASMPDGLDLVVGRRRRTASRHSVW